MKEGGKSWEPSALLISMIVQIELFPEAMWICTARWGSLGVPLHEIEKKGGDVTFEFTNDFARVLCVGQNHQLAEKYSG